jgi:predicted peptidase
MKLMLTRLRTLILAFVAVPLAACAAETGFLDRSVMLDGVTYRYQVYVPVDYTPTKSWPIALFLHGSGERGEDGTVQTQAGLPAAIRGERERFPLIVVMPQARSNTRWSGAMAAQAMKALEQSSAEFHGDPQRTYLTGLSMGGQGVWLLAASHPHKFAAIAPVCGFIDLANDDDVIGAGQDALYVQYPDIRASDPFAAFTRRIAKTPTWIFHGAVDDVVPVTQSRGMAQALRAAGAEVRYSEYPGVNHGAWDRAYAEPELVPWLLSHRLDVR